MKKRIVAMLVASLLPCAVHTATERPKDYYTTQLKLIRSKQLPEALALFKSLPLEDKRVLLGMIESGVKSYPKEYNYFLPFALEVSRGSRRQLLGKMALTFLGALFAPLVFICSDTIRIDLDRGVGPAILGVSGISLMGLLRYCYLLGGAIPDELRNFTIEALQKRLAPPQKK